MAIGWASTAAPMRNEMIVLVLRLRRSAARDPDHRRHDEVPLGRVRDEGAVRSVHTPPPDGIHLAIRRAFLFFLLCHTGYGAFTAVLIRWIVSVIFPAPGRSIHFAGSDTNGASPHLYAPQDS